MCLHNVSCSYLPPGWLDLCLGSNTVGPEKHQKFSHMLSKSWGKSGLCDCLYSFRPHQAFFQSWRFIYSILAHLGKTCVHPQRKEKPHGFKSCNETFPSFLEKWRIKIVFPFKHLNKNNSYHYNIDYCVSSTKQGNPCFFPYYTTEAQPRCLVRYWLLNWRQNTAKWD